MGTRADFYIGKGKDAEWIGSIAWDGYRDGIPSTILNSHRPSVFRRRVVEWLKERNDATFPNQGWPWPWDDSSTSDCSYWYFEGRCWDVWPKISGGKGVWVPCDVAEPKWGNRGASETRQMAKFLKGCKPVEFPNMADKKQVTMGERSGLIVLTAGAL